MFNQKDIKELLGGKSSTNKQKCFVERLRFSQKKIQVFPRVKIQVLPRDKKLAKKKYMCCQELEIQPKIDIGFKFFQEEKV